MAQASVRVRSQKVLADSRGTLVSEEHSVLYLVSGSTISDRSANALKKARSVLPFKPVIITEDPAIGNRRVRVFSSYDPVLDAMGHGMDMLRRFTEYNAFLWAQENMDSDVTARATANSIVTMLHTSNSLVPDAERLKVKIMMVAGNAHSAGILEPKETSRIMADIEATGRSRVSPELCEFALDLEADIIHEFKPLIGAILEELSRLLRDVSPEEKLESLKRIGTNPYLFPNFLTSPRLALSEIYSVIVELDCIEQLALVRVIEDALPKGVTEAVVSVKEPRTHPDSLFHELLGSLSVSLIEK